MAQRDGAAVHVDAGRVGAQRLQPGDGHGREGFVDFVQVDVLDLHAGLLQRALRGGQRGLEHDDRVVAQHAHVVDACQRLHAQRLQAALVHDHEAAGAVADLAGGGRRAAPAFGDELDAGDALQRGVVADAFVGGVQLAGLGAVGHAHGHGHDLALEVAGLGGGDGAVVAFERVAVERVFLDAVVAGDHLGARELAELDAGVALFHAGAHVEAQVVLQRQRGGQAHGHAAHALDAGGDHDVHRARHHGLCREVQRLLRRAALAVDRGGGHRLGQARGQHRVARHVGGLLAGLADAAHDDVLDQGGVGVGALHERVEHLCGQVGRVPSGEAAVAAAAGGARGGDDIGFGHVKSPVSDRFASCALLAPRRRTASSEPTILGAMPGAPPLTGGRTRAGAAPGRRAGPRARLRWRSARAAGAARTGCPRTATIPTRG
ncbi:hypothetical protein D9M72_202660 [compost metagenome]